jgi:hypothetical protein
MKDPWQNLDQHPKPDQQQDPFANAPEPGQVKDEEQDSDISIGRTALLILAGLVLFMILVAIIPFFVEAIAFGIELIRSILSLSHRQMFYDKDYRLAALAMVLIITAAVILKAIRRR